VPSVGRASAIDAAAEIEALVRGVDMVFVTAGMGGGTGSGAAPVVAELAKQAGTLTVGIVTKPFSFEGRRRMQQALEAIDELTQHVDILIVVSNDKLLEIVPDGVPLQDAFSMADEILRQGITGISDIVVKPGLINVDFADVRSVMQDAGPALMGIGRGFGKTRARDAALAAVSSPLLDFPIEKAKGVVFTITGNSDMSLQVIMPPRLSPLASLLLSPLLSSHLSPLTSPRNLGHAPAGGQRGRVGHLQHRRRRRQHHLRHVGRRDLRRRDRRHRRRHLLRRAERGAADRRRRHHLPARLQRGAAARRAAAAAAARHAATVRRLPAAAAAAAAAGGRRPPQVLEPLLRRAAARSVSRRVVAAGSQDWPIRTRQSE